LRSSAPAIVAKTADNLTMPPKVIEEIKFKDGIEETNDTENRAA
jgi:hypothetical protein